MKTFADFGIDLNGRSGVEVATTCPQCSATRKKTKARCLSVNTIEGVWLCFHCDWRGTLKAGEESRSRPPKRIVKPTYTKPSSVPPLVRDWFAKRGISEDVIARHSIGLATVYMPQLEEEVPCIAFPYFLGPICANVKYRGLESKAFRQIAGAEKILYRQNSIQPEAVVITEGEIDALSVVEAGWSSVVSVPDGAPPANAKQYSSKFTFLDQEPNPFDGVQKIILAVDNDPPGKTLEAELARRLGPERCWRVRWPDGCKDSNDVLMQHSATVLKQCIDDAKPFPLEGVLTVEDAAEDVASLYDEGLRGGLSTGWLNLDQHYTIEPGQLTVVTGVPGHGKSEVLDALVINLATLHGWRFAICSPENLPVFRHIAKHLEKHTGFPLREGPTKRLPREELVPALDWLNRHMVFIAPDDNMSIEALLHTAKGLVSRYGIRGLLLDPWNELDHTRGNGQTETEYISVALGAVRRFARRNGVHVWLVAHPQKLYRREDGSYPVPTPYDISGSAHFRNKADNCLTVWRDENEPGSPVKIYVQKIRFREVGKVGVVELHWNPVNGRYSDAVVKFVVTH